MTSASRFSLIAIALVAAWQWATVNSNYQGNWTALYCTGALQPHPPLVESEHVYLFAGSEGYDGQIYHYIAHDPLLRSDLKKYVDNQRLRYRRILVPALAYALALGNQRWIDPAYEIAFLLLVGLGVFWSCRLAEQRGFPALWGLLFLLIPAIPVSMDRLVVDGALAVFTVGFVLYSNGPAWKLFLVLAAAALTRETGFFLIAASCLFQLIRREYKLAAILSASAAPALAWYAYVQLKTPAGSYPFSVNPFFGVLQAIANPLAYPAGTPFVSLIHVADYLAIAGGLLAIVFAFIRRPLTPVVIAAALLGALAVVLQRADLWQNAFDIGRLQSPLIICLAGIAATERKAWLLAPIALILPRVAIEFAPQINGVIHHAAG